MLFRSVVIRNATINAARTRSRKHKREISLEYLTEKQFESDIEYSLLTYGGYEKGDPKAFDRVTALDKATLISFVKSTQPKSWVKYETIYGTSCEKSFIERFCKEVKSLGLLSVLRHGFKDRGITFRVVYWKPETSINQTAKEQYERNILH